MIYLAVSMLAKAIDKGYLKVFAGLTLHQVCTSGSTTKPKKAAWTNLVRINDQQKQPSHQGSDCHPHLKANRLTLWNFVPRNHSMLVHTLSSQPSSRSLACCSATNQAGSLSFLTEATSTLSSSSFMMLMLSNLSQSRANQRKSSCEHICWFVITSQHGASNCNFTRWTMSKEKTCPQSTHPTSTAPIRRNGKFALGKTTSSLALLGFQRPSRLRCHLTDQTDFTLNMLPPCHKNSDQLAFKALKESYLFNATLMAPLGTEVLAHHKPNQRLSWGFHSLKVWYISLSLQYVLPWE
jgi:hypothetical protein